MAAPTIPTQGEGKMQEPKMIELAISTHSRTELVDITSQVERVVGESGVEEGVCYLYVPHTTAAITINEDADPSVRRDILDTLNRLIPFEAGYSHLEGNAAAHVKSAMVGASRVVFIKNGRLALGRWQGIYFCEFDGPRQRRIWIEVRA